MRGRLRRAIALVPLLGCVLWLAACPSIQRAPEPDPADAIRGYYEALVEGRPEEAWSWLHPDTAGQLAAISHQSSSDALGTASDLSQARTGSRCSRIEHPVNRLEGARAESAADPKREPDGGEKWRLDRQAFVDLYARRRAALIARSEAMLDAVNAGPATETARVQTDRGVIVLVRTEQGWRVQDWLPGVAGE